MATTYYAEGGPLWETIQSRRAALGGTIPSVGIIGLGGGAMACNAAPGETWTFFEIDPEVVGLARDSGLFPFVPDCTPDARIVVGDARLTLQDERPAAFDILIVDAFTSDAIPAHLLTAEAMALYASRVTEHGAVVFHISNRHMELASVVADIAARNGFSAFGRAHQPGKPITEFPHATASEVAAVVRDPGNLPVVIEGAGWRPIESTGQSIWTDDHANGLAAIWRKLSVRLERFVQ